MNFGNAYAPTEDRHVRAVMFSSSPKAGICTHCSVLLLFLFLMLLNKSTQWLSGMTHTEQNEDDAPRRETTESYTTARTFEPTSQALCSPCSYLGSCRGLRIGRLDKERDPTSLPVVENHLTHSLQVRLSALRRQDRLQVKPKEQEYFPTRAIQPSWLLTTS